MYKPEHTMKIGLYCDTHEFIVVSNFNMQWKSTLSHKLYSDIPDTKLKTIKRIRFICGGKREQYEPVSECVL